MPERRDIDERDIDHLLAALTDLQIAALFGMPEEEVFKLRQSRQNPAHPVGGKPNNKDKPET